MKKGVLLFCFFAFQLVQIKAQRFAYTGKAWSIGASIQPVTSFYQKNNSLKLNALSGSFSISKKIFRGIYPTIGYTYSNSKETVDLNPRTMDVNALNIIDAHSINSGVLFQKHLMVTQSRKISSGCFRQTLSLILAPEYNYMFINGLRTNKSNGELALKMGVCLFNSYSGTAPKTILWDLYYRKGFTPIVSYNDQFGKHQFYKDEIGIQLRIIFRQRYDFLK
jgi:hypothetical protein